MMLGVNQNVQVGLQGNMQGTAVGLRDTAKEAALLALMKDTGYPIYQENGQRKYGPCPFWTGTTPSRGCEVFVGKLPRDCYEDELVPILSRVGTIYELRLMMEFSGSNRGFCFVTYTQPDDAKRAVRELNNFEIRKGKFLGVCQSVDNCRLFVGGLPREKKQEEILEELRGLAEGVVKCIVYADARDKTKNRGFAFVEFESHRAAAMARRKLVGGGPVQLWGQQIAIDWAEPEVEIDEDIMSQVKILYIRNLMLDTGEEKIEMLCNRALKKADAIERVKKLRDYAFVHFKERSDAIAAMKELNGMEVDGATIEVVLAKPVDKKSPKKPSKPEHQPILGLPGLTYIPASSLVTSPTPESLSGHDSRALLGRNPLVMGTREGSKGRVRGAGGIGRIYSQTRSPYRKTSTEGRSVGFYPGMEMIIASPFIFSPPLAQAKLPTQILEEICTTIGWGQPVYQLFAKQEAPMDVHFYFCKMILPSVPDTLFQSNVLTSVPEEAKNMVAQSALTELYKRGLISEGMLAAILNNPAVGPHPGVLPTSPGLPNPGPAQMLATSGVYAANPSLIPTSPPQFVLTNGSYGDLHSDFAPASSVMSVVTNPVYFMSGGKVPNGNTIPVVSSIPYATIPVPGYKF